jgi:exodeoxyribonuclease-3
MLKIATWNVNSLRVRLPQLLEWLKLQQADIVALQEIKVVDELFPLAEINAASYHCIFAGQKTYNGVALLSRVQGTQIQTDFQNYADPQRRVLAVSYGDVRVINVYIPNGSEVGSEKFAYKLEWLSHLKTLVAESLKTYPHLILLGDFNIAPRDEDVCDPEAYRDGILTYEMVRDSLQALYELGMQDVFQCFP